MTLPRSVADVVSRHVLFEIEAIDRMYLNVYVPGLQYAAGRPPALEVGWVRGVVHSYEPPG